MYVMSHNITILLGTVNLVVLIYNVSCNQCITNYFSLTICSNADFLFCVIFFRKYILLE